MKILVDTGPIVSAVDKSDPAHEMAKTSMKRLRRRAVVPTTVLVEADHLLRERVDSTAARAFLQSIADGTHEVAYMTSKLIRRATEFDSKYADLNLGFVDSAVMAIAERHQMPVFTFDFTDFRATESATGPWRLAIDENLFQRETQR
jgi:predicted nucleic acid-binding protein